MVTFTVKDGYSKGKVSGTYRNPENIAEMIQWCSSHSHITVLADNGLSRTVKINGKVRTWKRDPNRVEVPFKYGLYEYGTWTDADISRILIPA